MWVFRYPGRPRWSTRVNHEQNCCPVQLLGRQKRGTRTSCWSSLPWGQLRYSWFVTRRLNLCFKSDFPLSWTLKICYLWRMRTSSMVCLLAYVSCCWATAWFLKERWLESTSCLSKTKLNYTSPPRHALLCALTRLTAKWLSAVTSLSAWPILSTVLPWSSLTSSTTMVWTCWLPFLTWR